jgi:hypothetical protein
MNSSHTNGIYTYMNCKRKLLHCNANIKFNHTCLKKKLIPNYVRIKVPTYNNAAKKTQAQAQTLRIKNEIKFIYKKEQQLNIKLYHAHIHNAKIWQNTWYDTQNP